MMLPERCARMIGSGVLARHDRAPQIDGEDAVERRLADVGERRVAAGDGDADVVVQDVDATEAPFRLRHGSRQAALLRHVGRESHTSAAVLLGQRRGFLGGVHIAVDGQHLRAFLREAQCGRPAVADPFAGALPGADDHRDFPLKTHADPRVDKTVGT